MPLRDSSPIASRWARPSDSESDRLPAGPASRALHRFAYTTDGARRDVLVEQVEPAAEGSDRFGFRLTVGGERYRVRGVEVLCDLHRREDGGWSFFSYDAGDDGAEAYQLMFNTRLLLPTESAFEAFEEEVYRLFLKEHLWSADDLAAVARSKAFDRGSAAYTGFTGTEGGRDRAFRFCTIGVACEQRTKTLLCNVYVFHILIAPWPRAGLFEERLGRAPHPPRATLPAGPFSHAEFVMQEGRRMVAVRQAFGGEALKGFGFNLWIDGFPKVVRSVGVCLLESSAETGLREIDETAPELTLFQYTPGPNGADAFRLMFNSELLRPGDEKRVLDALVPEPGLLDAVSAAILRRVRAGHYVRSLTGFDCRLVGFDDGGGGGEGGAATTFSFCTCCAFPVGNSGGGGSGGWQFKLLVFEVLFG